MNYKEIRKYLIEKNGNRCSICGKEFDEFNIPIIDHIVPYVLGGENDIENMQLTCSFCNILKGAKIISTEAFEKYIEAIIENSEKYDIIKNVKLLDNGFDLFLKDKEQNEYKMCEIKINTSFTSDRVNYIAESLKKCEENAKKQYKNVKSVFIFPGKLSPKMENILKLNGIEIWDREYLKSNFKKEILKTDSTYANSILRINEKSFSKIINIYEKKINKLKECKCGFDDWNKYQKLIGEILELLFCPTLNTPIEETFDKNKQNRRDFIIPNYAEKGFWNFIRQKYKADFIVIDAKNSGKGIEKEDILQVANYLKEHRNWIIWNYNC